MVQWYYLVIASSILMGLSSIVEKISLKREHATEFSSALTLLVALFSLVFIPLANFAITAQQLLIVIIAGVLNAYTFLLTARVFKHGEISIATTAFSSLPTLLTVVLAFFFLNERLVPLQYLSVLVVLAASYFLVFRPQKRIDGKDVFDDDKYRWMIVLYVILSAIGSIIGKYLLLQVNPYTLLIITGTVMSVFYAIYISVKYNGVREIAQTVEKYKVPLGVNALLTLGYRVSYFVALTSALAPVSVAQPLRNTLYVIMSVIAGGIVFNEENIAKKLVLSIITIVFVYVLVNPSIISSI